MSRVEPKEQEKQPPAREADRKPSKAEGDEVTVDEALRRSDEEKRPKKKCVVPSA